MNTYYAKEFLSDRWHTIERGSNVPIHDHAPHRPLVFTDHDAVMARVKMLNEQAIATTNAACVKTFSLCMDDSQIKIGPPDCPRCLAKIKRAEKQAKAK